MTDDHKRQKAYKEKKPQKTFNLEPDVIARFEAFMETHGYGKKEASKAFEHMLALAERRNDPNWPAELRRLADYLEREMR